MDQEAQAFKHESDRIRWRQDLLALVGGPEWLCRIGELFGWNERCFGPDDVGMPDGLRVQMHARGW